MANGLFAKAKESLLKGEINLPTDNLKIVLVDHGSDTPVLATDQFLSDIGAGARIATSGNLTTKTVTNGVFDADDVTIAGVTGATVESVVLYQDTGVAATSRLILMLDTATGLVLTPNGASVTVAWDNGANKIFAL